MARTARTTKPPTPPAAPPPSGPRILTCRQGTDEWQRERAGRIGGSDANVIGLVSPYMTPFELYQVKLGLRPRPEGFILNRGHELEPKIRRRFEAATGLLVDPVVMVAANDWQITSLDGRTLDGDLVAEFKMLDLESYEQAEAGILPAKYVPQTLHNVGVAEAEQLLLGCYHEATDRFCIVEVAPDPQAFAVLTAQELEFRTRLLAKVPPELCDRDVVVREDAAWLLAATAWAAAKLKVDEAEATLEKKRQALIDLAGIHNARGHGALVTFASRAGSVDYARLCKDHGIHASVIEGYRKPRTAYTLVAAEKVGKEKL